VNPCSSLSEDERRSTDERWMRRAIELAHLCPPAAAAYSVGAVIVDEDGKEIAWGYSRESDPRVHAEESALAKLPADDPRHRHAVQHARAVLTSSEPAVAVRAADPRRRHPPGGVRLAGAEPVRR
jgi:pyrimidine deaminase RibD-like protein